jgi:hypothetical protein
MMVEPLKTTICGWWFGTCFIFPSMGNNNPNIYGIILPIDEYFSRWLLHHQPDMVIITNWWNMFFWPPLMVVNLGMHPWNNIGKW